MTEGYEAFHPTKLIFKLVRTAAFLLFLVTLLVLLYGIIAKGSENELQRFAVEFGDSIARSNLTADKAVFLADELDRYSGLDEPIKYCGLASRITVKRISDKKEWRFGYSPKDPVKSSKAEFRSPVVVSGNGIEQAELKVELYSTFTTEISCMIETAYNKREVQSKKFSCPGYLRSHYGKCGFAIRNKDGDASSDAVCLFFHDSKKNVVETDCRHLPDIAIAEQSLFYKTESGTIEPISKEKGKDRILKAIPVNRIYARDALDKECDDIDLERVIANEKDETVIVFCFEKPKE